MSGGNFNYKYTDLEYTYAGQMGDMELNKMIVDLSDLLHDLEWYLSGDYNEETYRESVQAFKDKWFGKRDLMLRKLVAKELDIVKKELQNFRREANYDR